MTTYLLDSRLVHLFFHCEDYSTSLPENPIQTVRRRSSISQRSLLHASGIRRGTLRQRFAASLSWTDARLVGSAVEPKRDLRAIIRSQTRESSAGLDACLRHSTGDGIIFIERRRRKRYI